MPLSNFAAITALVLTMYNEIPKFIKKEEKDLDFYYVAFSVIISALWFYYHTVNNSTIGKIGAGMFLFINLVLLVRCLQQRTGFLKSRTSPSK